MDQRKSFRDVASNRPLAKGDVIDMGTVYGYRPPMREAPPTIEALDAIWMVVQSEHRQERTADAELCKAGLHTFLPQYQAKVRRSNRYALANRGKKFELVTRVLFPGYLFVRTGIEAGHWKRAFACKGVKGVIVSGDRPSPVPDHEVAKLMARRNGGVDAATPDVPFGVGERVRVDDGPFCGFDAIVEEILTGQVDEATAVKVLMSMFGREVRIRLSVDALTRL